jgi:hypothetical protein
MYVEDQPMFLNATCKVGDLFVITLYYKVYNCDLYDVLLDSHSIVTERVNVGVEEN